MHVHNINHVKHNTICRNHSVLLCVFFLPFSFRQECSHPTRNFLVLDFLCHKKLQSSQRKQSLSTTNGRKAKFNANKVTDRSEVKLQFVRTTKSRNQGVPCQRRSRGDRGATGFLISILLEICQVLKFYSHQPMQFLKQICIGLLSYIRNT